MKSYVGLKLLVSFVLAVVVCFVAVSVTGQTTVSGVVDFAILNPDQDARLFVASQGYLRVDARNPEAISAIAITIDVDSMDVLTKGRERHFIFKVLNVGTDSIIDMLVREFGSHTSKDVRKFKIDHPGGPFYPALNVLSGVYPPIYFDVNLSFGPLDSISVDDSYVLYYQKSKLLTVSDDGALPIYSEPTIDSTIVLVLDTLQTAGDTIYMDPIAGDNGFLSMFLETIPKSGTGIRFGLGYQVKHRYASNWSGDLIENEHLFVLSDSLFMDEDSLRAARLQYIPADSLRFVVYGKSALRAIFKRVKVLWRD